MGEGWGDFFAICMTSQETDDFAKGVFAVGGWTDLTPTFKDNYYFSIRRYPYSADMTKNPLTFKHIGNNVVLPTGPPINPSPAGNNEVHNAGEVWCAALWEVFVNLVAKHGHAEAERRMLEYVIGGLKLTPMRRPSPRPATASSPPSPRWIPATCRKCAPASPSAAWARARSPRRRTRRHWRAWWRVLRRKGLGLAAGARGGAEAPPSYARSPSPEPRDPRTTTARRPRP